MQVGEFVEQRPGLGRGGEDAAHGGQGEGPEAHGSFKSGLHIGTPIMSEQGQQLLRLLFAIRLLPQQAIEELERDGTQFAEALPQEPFALPGIVDGMMALERLLHAGLRAGHEPMTGDFLQADRVDDDLAVGDTDGEHLADVRPGDRVQVEPMGDVALDVDVAIDDQGGVEVAGGQRQEVRLFALMALQRRFLEVAQACARRRRWRATQPSPR